MLFMSKKEHIPISFPATFDVDSGAFVFVT